TDSPIYAVPSLQCAATKSGQGGYNYEARATYQDLLPGIPALHGLRPNLLGWITFRKIAKPHRCHSIAAHGKEQGVNRDLVRPGTTGTLAPNAPWRNFACACCRCASPFDFCLRPSGP